MITQKYYGTTSKGEKVNAFTIETENGNTVTLLEYGCIIESLKIKLPLGEERDIILGYDNLKDYESDTSGQGAFIGQYANRIENACFTIDNKEYNLSKNNGENHLHGVFAKKVFTGSIESDCVIFTAKSPDGEDGFPGNVNLTVTYSFADNGELKLDYKATTDAKTIINLTNHSYFNLDGVMADNVLTQTLWLNSKTFTEANEHTCPTGVILNVENTPMDFTSAKEIGQEIASDYYQLVLASGYDHNYIIDKKEGELSLCAIAKSTDGRIMLETYTTQPAVQLYTANFLEAIGKHGKAYGKYGAFCLETQHYPCTPSHKEFPSVTLLPTEEYHEITIYKVLTSI